jgi:hypothetical protein
LTDTQDRLALEVVERSPDIESELPDPLIGVPFTSNAAWALRFATTRDVEAAAKYAAWYAGMAAAGSTKGSAWDAERRSQSDLLREIFGDPFYTLPPRPEATAPLADQIYAGAWDKLPLLGELLQEYGYWSEGEHCLDPKIQHVKGCWVIDWITGRM